MITRVDLLTGVPPFAVFDGQELATLDDPLLERRFCRPWPV